MAHHADPVSTDSSTDSGVHQTMMHMWFQASTTETILFSCWATTGFWSLFMSCLAIFALAFAYEGLKSWRERMNRTRLVKSGSESESESPPSDKNVHVHIRLTSTLHLAQTLLHILQVTTSYLLMLIVMTYNVWLCLAVVLGAGLGYFVFAWRGYASVSEQCH